MFKPNIKKILICQFSNGSQVQTYDFGTLMDFLWSTLHNIFFSIHQGLTNQNLIYLSSTELLLQNAEILGFSLNSLYFFLGKLENILLVQ